MKFHGILWNRLAMKLTFSGGNRFAMKPDKVRKMTLPIETEDL